MPFRSPKMNSFIFGFHRFVWWPKCTPASSRSLIAIPDNRCLLVVLLLLAFAEREALARASQSVLLPFLHTRVRGEQPVLLQLPAELRVELDERPGDAQPDGAGLAVHPAAGDGGEHVELVTRFREHQGPSDLGPQRVGREIVAELAMVHGNRPLAGAKEHAGRGRLAATGGVVLDA